jgi:hypothetical protein
VSSAAPPDRSEARRSAARTFGSASVGGFVAFVASALAGQLVGLAEWVAGARAYGARLPLKLGWLYLVSFHRVGFRLSSIQPFGLGDAPGPASPPGRYDYTVRVAVLAGTILAGVMLYRAGRMAASHAGARPWLGAAVAPAYAAPIFLGSLFVTLRFPDAGVEAIKPIAWEAFVFPFAFAAITGLAGGMSTARLEGPSNRFATRVRAGWQMFAVAVVLAFVGFVVLAGVRPDSSGAYLRWIGREGRIGALVATHHLVLLPDQSLWILAPAMGSCDSLVGGPSEPTTLCFRTFTVRSGWGAVAFGPPAQTELPLPFLLFMLVPAIAVVAVSARSITSRSLGARVVDGMASGAVFAAIVWLAAVASRISIDNATASGGSALISVGPDPVRTGLLALAWGIVGGAIGAGLPATRPQEGKGVPEDEPVPAPPKPTSV